MTILIVYPKISYTKHNTEIQSDILNVLSSLKVKDIDNDYVKQLISEGKIEDENISILEQIGIFYITDKDTAKILARESLSDLDTPENIGIWFGNDLIYSSNTTPYEKAKTIETSRQIISGIGGTDNSIVYNTIEYIYLLS